MTEHDAVVGQNVPVRSGQSHRIRVHRSARLVDARWSRTEARSGDQVELVAEGAFPEGEAVTFRIMEADSGSDDDFVAELRGSMVQGTARVEWSYVYTDDEDDEGSAGPYTKPEYYFICSASGQAARSGLLELRDTVEIALRDEFGRPLQGAHYTLILPGGGERQGVADERGCAREEAVPPGRYQVRLGWRDSPGRGTPAGIGGGQDASSAVRAAESSPNPSIEESPGARDVKVRLTDEFGRALRGSPFVLVLPDGSEITGQLDGRGEAVVPNVPPGHYQVRPGNPNGS